MNGCPRTLFLPLKQIAPDAPQNLGVHTYPNRTTRTQPEECFLKPMLARSAGELKYAQGGYAWKPYNCRYDLMNSEARLSCFRDKNVTRFLDFGDRRVWRCECVRACGLLSCACASLGCRRCFSHQLILCVLFRGLRASENRPSHKKGGCASSAATVPPLFLARGLDSAKQFMRYTYDIRSNLL